MVEFMDALNLDHAVFAGFDWGGRAGCVAAAIWPERCTGLVSVTGYLIQNVAAAATPFAAPRGARAFVDAILELNDLASAADSV